MAKPEILVTGASGEVGHGLIAQIKVNGLYDVVAVDLRQPDSKLARLCSTFYCGDLRDKSLAEQIQLNHDFEAIFHMAGLLSTAGERNPLLAHDVNVNGSLNILTLAKNQGAAQGRVIRFLFASSIAVYGVEPNEQSDQPIGERAFLEPCSMYGINKLYVEQLGHYFNDWDGPGRIDFRCVRFPGLISAETMPTGGTTDYAPEMLHAAARGDAYSCFVNEQTRLPFAVMSDAVNALINLDAADKKDLNQCVYNVNGFSVTAAEIRAMVIKHFPAASIDFDPNAIRQAIVDRWPRDIDDEPARKDWGWQPRYGFNEAFSDVLVPQVKAYYRSQIEY